MRCWLLHRWGKWIELYRSKVQLVPRYGAEHKDGWEPYWWVEITETRQCERCGKTDMRKVAP